MLNCYNGIVIRSAVEFQQHEEINEATNIEALYTDEAIRTDEIESTNSLSFSKAIEVITKILYGHEKEKKNQRYILLMNFGRLWRGCKIKSFFDELYLSSTLRKIKIRKHGQKQHLFVCYFLCGIRNKFVNDAVWDLASDVSGFYWCFRRLITRYKTAASKEHTDTVDSAL